MQRQNIKKISGFIPLLFLLVFFAPTFIYAQNRNTGTAPANTGITYDCANENSGAKPGECTFADLVKATQKFINYASLFAIAFSVVVIAYVGGEYMIYSDNPGKRATASKRLFSVLKGTVFILAAWLIVTLITKALVPGINTFLS